MFDDAISYPSNADDWLKPLLIGGSLILFSFLIIPGFLVQGYSIRVLRSAAKDEDTPPSFTEWGDLLVDGLKMTIISLCYFIPCVIIIILMFVVTSDGGLALLLAVFLLLVVVGYIYYVALTNFALAESIGAAFELRQIINAAFTSRYFIAVILSVIAGAVLYFVALLLFVTYIGILIGAIVQFYAQVMVYYLLARGCGPCLQSEPEDHEQVDSPSSPTG